MKKAVIWAMAAMMILGSLKALAADVDLTEGKLEQAEDTMLEMDIQTENTNGKIAAWELEKSITTIRANIDKLYALQDDLAGLEDSHGLIKKIGMIADLHERELRAIEDSLNVSLAKKSEIAVKNRVEILRAQVERELAGK